MRDYAALTVDGVDDGDWCKLTSPAQALYTSFLRSPDLNRVGELPITPNAWSSLAADWTEPLVKSLLSELTKAKFVVVDLDRDRLMVRSYVRYDRTLTKWQHVTAVLTAANAVKSPILRRALAEELARIPLAGLPDGSVKQNQAVNIHRERMAAVIADLRATPDPFDRHAVDSIGNPIANRIPIQLPVGQTETQTKTQTQTNTPAPDLEAITSTEPGSTMADATVGEVVRGEVTAEETAPTEPIDDSPRSPVKTKTKSAEREMAEQLTNAWLTAVPPQPQKWIAVVKVVETALVNGMAPGPLFDKMLDTNKRGFPISAGTLAFKAGVASKAEQGDSEMQRMMARAEARDALTDARPSLTAIEGGVAS
jgi:hypothetical protein